MQSLSFQSQNLVVDYISFKFQEFDHITKKQIASYLYKIGFNVSQQSGKLAKPPQELISFNQENKYQALFVNEAPYWDGTVLHFQGANVAVFYRYWLDNLFFCQSWAI
jgi:hypothetical protein